jgi:hypothetical protein
LRPGGVGRIASRTLASSDGGALPGGSDPSPAVIPHPHVRPSVDERCPVPEPHPHRHRVQGGGMHRLAGATPNRALARRVESILRAMGCDRSTPARHVTADPRHPSWERRSPRSSLYPGLPRMIGGAASPSPTRAVSLRTRNVVRASRR